MREGFLNTVEQVPGLTNRPLVVSAAGQKRQEWGGAEGAAATLCDQEMALFVTLPMPIFTCTSSGLGKLFN